jgi:hypothetical protein
VDVKPDEIRRLRLAFIAYREAQRRAYGDVIIEHSGRCGAELNALLDAVKDIAAPAVPAPQPQENKDDLSRVDRSAISDGQDLPRKPQPDNSQPPGVQAVEDLARALAFVAEFQGDPRCSLNCRHAEALLAAWRAQDEALQEIFGLCGIDGHVSCPADVVGYVRRALLGAVTGADSAVDPVDGIGEGGLRAPNASFDTTSTLAAVPAQEEGITLIAAERRRQQTAEGWTAAHDKTHREAEMVAAACCYAALARRQADGTVQSRAEHIAAPSGWPWDWEWWKPSDDPRRNLVKAGALIAAEIDRLRAPAAPHDVRETTENDDKSFARNEKPVNPSTNPATALPD